MSSDDIPSLDIPPELVADSDGVDSVTLLEFVYCVLARGSPYQTLKVQAPSKDLADLTITQLLRKACDANGLPADTLTWSDGAC